MYYYHLNSGEIRSTGAPSAYSAAAGLIARDNAAGDITISKCYNSGTIRGARNTVPELEQSNIVMLLSFIATPNIPDIEYPVSVAVILVLLWQFFIVHVFFAAPTSPPVSPCTYIFPDIKYNKTIF